MLYEKATTKDIPILTDLRIAYLQEDLGVIAENDLQKLQTALPGYYEKHLNKDLMVYVAREDARACDVSVVELKATGDGYPLYKSIGFVDVGTQYHNMKIVLK